MFYLVLFFIVAIVAILNQYLWNRKIDRVLSVIFCLVLITLGTIRWKTGFDWLPYQSFYIYVRDYITHWSELKISFEPIFTSFYFIAKHTGLGFIFVQFLQILIIILCKYSVYKRYTPYVFLALFLNFCFFPDIVTIRNYLAASVVLVSLKFVEQRRLFPFILTILIATNIHFSSIVSLLIYPIYYRMVSLPFKIAMILLCIVLGLVGVFEYILLPFKGVLEGSAGEKLNYYVNASESGTANTKGFMSIILGLSRRLIILPFILYFEFKHFKEDRVYRGLSNLFIFGNCVYFLVGNSSFMIFQRISIPFYLCEVLLLVMIFAKTRLKLFIMSFFVLYGFVKYYYIYNEAATVQPYITIFNYKEKESKYWEIWKPEPPEIFR